MLGFGKKQKELSDDKSLYAPLSGQIIELEKVSDPIFAKKVMGDGYAVEPTDTKIISPVAGTVSLVQGHAIGLMRADGLEILLHVGIDTVSLNGVPFNFKVKVGDVVDGGDVLGKVDWLQVEAAGMPKTTMVLITNTADKLADLQVDYIQADAGQKIGQATAK